MYTLTLLIFIELDTKRLIKRSIFKMKVYIVIKYIYLYILSLLILIELNKNQWKISIFKIKVYIENNECWCVTTYKRLINRSILFR